MTSTPQIPPEDFPQMWQKPAFEDILECLLNLRVEPPIWKWNSKHSPARLEDNQKKPQDLSESTRQAIARYLSSVISSPLSWLEDDEQRDALWTEAGRRLSERCGRAAMGEIIRSWPFESQNGYSPFELVIREPPLTGDSLGLKTWGSSYALAQMLGQFAVGPLQHLIQSPTSSSSPQPPPLTKPHVLELGSGTGLLGLAAAAIWACQVTLSDLPDIMPNLRHNVERNQSTIKAMGGDLAAGALTWGGDGDDEIDPDLFGDKNQFEMVIVADPMYDDDHPGLLAGAIDDQLAISADARALVMVPRRDVTTIGLLSSFRQLMEEGSDASFVCKEEGIVASQDDWGDDEEDEAQKNVECWWGIFQRR
ncbi:hypothetical protein PpBr36_00708 [Pyricularia pennisetigena]|uniref:hypothetical protein n=1 Tax=Pyricularia pennisetigena TaxID=1578925 RepID=UPI0011542BB6|nr:hypothetical protein PpBr36_00708 [Pyricularia pennisetigena]TLS28004.1 hypothetical protein PpBr36_00708 [Pyricularia pennisetigena]